MSVCASLCALTGCLSHCRRASARHCIDFDQLLTVLSDHLPAAREGRRAQLLLRHLLQPWCGIAKLQLAWDAMACYSLLSISYLLSSLFRMPGKAVRPCHGLNRIGLWGRFTFTALAALRRYCHAAAQQLRGADVITVCNACAVADGNQLVAAVGSRIIIFNAADGELLHQLKGHKESTLLVAIDAILCFAAIAAKHGYGHGNGHGSVTAAAVLVTACKTSVRLLPSVSCCYTCVLLASPVHRPDIRPKFDNHVPTCDTVPAPPTPAGQCVLLVVRAQWQALCFRRR